MRKQLLLSTGIVCLMLAPSVSFGQSPGGRNEEQKQMRPSEAGKGAASQERAQGTEQKAQGAAGREERGGGSRQTKERFKAAPSSERPSTASDDKRGRGDDTKSERARQDSRQGRDAQTAREGKDAKDSSARDNNERAKGRAETDRDNTTRGKSAAEQQKSREGTTAQQEREGTAANQQESGRDQHEGAKSAAEQGKDANRPSTATDTTRTQPPTSAQNAPAGSSTQTTQSRTNQTQISQQSNISTKKQVRISQTLTRERLAPPERNLNIAIRIGEPVPQTVRFHRLPPEIVSIEPEYRDYEYFSTDDDIVIVEPRTKRIVSQIPRDVSRIRARATRPVAARQAPQAGTPARWLPPVAPRVPHHAARYGGQCHRAHAADRRFGGTAGDHQRHGTCSRWSDDRADCDGCAGWTDRGVRPERRRLHGDDRAAGSMRK